MYDMCAWNRERIGHGSRKFSTSGTKWHVETATFSSSCVCLCHKQQQKHEQKNRRWWGLFKFSALFHWFMSSLGNRIGEPEKLQTSKTAHTSCVCFAENSNNDKTYEQWQYFIVHLTFSWEKEEWSGEGSEVGMLGLKQMVLQRVTFV